MTHQTHLPTAPAPIEGLGVTRTALLLLIARYGYVTNLQLAYRRGSPKSESFYRTHTAAMEQEGLLLRLHLPREQPAGQGRAVFTLTARSRKLLQRMDVDVPGRYRPSEERRKSGSLPLAHSLAVTDWTIAQDKLCDAYPAVQERDFVSERDLNAAPLAVQLPRRRGSALTETVRFAPDGWHSLALDIGGGFEFSYFIEVDRGSEYQRQIRRRVASYLHAATSKDIRERFSASMTVAIITPDAPDRAATLLKWIEAEISAARPSDHQRLEQADIFRVSSANPATNDPLELFFGPCWQRPFQREELSLIPAPDTPETGGER